MQRHFFDGFTRPTPINALNRYQAAYDAAGARWIVLMRQPIGAHASRVGRIHGRESSPQAFRRSSWASTPIMTPKLRGRLSLAAV